MILSVIRELEKILDCANVTVVVKTINTRLQQRKLTLWLISYLIVPFCRRREMYECCSLEGSIPGNVVLPTLRILVLFYSRQW